MINSNLTQLLPHLAGARLTQDAAFAGVSTDSRNIAPGNLFVALKGERFDAHDYLEQVAAQGAAAVVAERVPAGFTLPALVVPDTRAALGEIAAWWRRQCTLAGHRRHRQQRQDHRQGNDRRHSDGRPWRGGHSGHARQPEQ